MPPSTTPSSIAHKQMPAQITPPVAQQQMPAQTPTSATPPSATQSPIIPNPPQNPNPVSIHPMVTCYRVGSNRPTQHLIIHVSSVSPLPKSYREAFNDTNWQNAMRDEYNALIKNQTWTLVPRPTDTNIIHFYMNQPPGFRDSAHPDYECLLQQSLYGLKQAPRAWFQRKGTDTAYLLLYVDDIVLTASSEILLQQIIVTPPNGAWTKNVSGG
ncbi:ribonuclease H-like domain-containing protein, partial [Tanacetum coccineum]